MDKTTSIQITKETRQYLQKIGHKEQTYDEIIKDLIKEKIDPLIGRNQK